MRYEKPEITLVANARPSFRVRNPAVPRQRPAGRTRSIRQQRMNRMSNHSSRSGWVLRIGEVHDPRQFCTLNRGLRLP